LRKRKDGEVASSSWALTLVSRDTPNLAGCSPSGKGKRTTS
jgi:hypothetical protein